MKTFTILSGLAGLAAAAPFPTGFPGPTAGGPAPFPVPTGSGLPFPAPTGGFPGGPFANATGPAPSGYPHHHHHGHYPHPYPGSAPLPGTAAPPPAPLGTAPPPAPSPVGTSPPSLSKRQRGGAGGFSWPSMSFATPTGGFDTGSGSGFGAGGGNGGGFGFSSISFPVPTQSGAFPSQSAFGFGGEKRQFSGLPSFSGIPSFSGFPSISLPTGGAGAGGLPTAAPSFSFLKEFRGYQGHISAGDDRAALATSTTTTA